MCGEEQHSTMIYLRTAPQHIFTSPPLVLSLDRGDVPASASRWGIQLVGEEKGGLVWADLATTVGGRPKRPFPAFANVGMV